MKTTYACKGACVRPHANHMCKERCKHHYAVQHVQYDKSCRSRVSGFQQGTTVRRSLRLPRYMTRLLGPPDSPRHLRRAPTPRQPPAPDRTREMVRLRTRHSSITLSCQSSCRQRQRLDMGKLFICSRPIPLYHRIML